MTNVTDATGTPQWSYSYEPFGSSRTTTKINPLAPDNPMQFTGQYLDPTGLYHLRARQYDSGLGRFMATDPRTPPITSPAVSPYVYVNNRPTVLVDPSGFCGWTEPWRCVDDAAKGARRHANDGLGAVVGGIADVTGGTPRKCGNATCVQGNSLVTGILDVFGADAVTVGHTIVGNDALSDQCFVQHELAHVRQYERSGPFFLPIYGWDAIFNGSGRENVYEMEAYAVEDMCRADQILGQSMK